MNNIKERLGGDDFWFTVKQNYNPTLLFRNTKILNEYLKTNKEESYETFFKRNIKEGENDNYRNTKILLDLNLLKNKIVPNKKIKYKNYIIAENVIKSLNDYDSFKKVVATRMINKEKILKFNSNKGNRISKKVSISPYKLLINFLDSYWKENQINIIKNEIFSNFVVYLKENSEIEELLELIKDYENNSLSLKKKNNESRFMKTISFFDFIEKKENNYIFDPKKVEKLISNNFVYDSVIKEEMESIIENDKKEKYVKNFSGEGRDTYLQSKFRKDLLNEFNGCAFCNLDKKILLTASHIKAVNESFNEEKYSEFTNVNNGLLLCKNHDILFDSHNIFVEDNGEIKGNLCNVHTNKFVSKKYLNTERKKFLKHHRNKHIKKYKNNDKN